VELLERELLKEHDITRCREGSSAQELRQLLVSVGLVIASRDDPSRLIIPLALKGRPVSWKEVHQLQSARVLGRRLGSSTSRVPASAFMHLMTSKCRAQGRMMGCAFVYAMQDEGLVFVRLLEDRSKVDVVVVSSRREDALAEVRAVFAVDCERMLGVLTAEFAGERHQPAAGAGLQRGEQRADAVPALLQQRHVCPLRCSARV
jgi:hypothetical protein